MDRLQRLQQQSKKRYSNYPNRDFMPVNANRSITAAAPGPAADRPDYRQLLAGAGLVRPILAVSYREDLQADSTLAGAWKQFKSAQEAHIWHSKRARAGAALYTGRAIYYHLDQVLAAWEDPGTVPTLARAVGNYLDWRVKNRI